MKNDKPYLENVDEEKIVRKFSFELDAKELVWHRDRHDRIVKVLDGKDWQFQLDDQLPVYLERNHVFLIPKETYHRIIKGVDDLIIEIKEIK